MRRRYSAKPGRSNMDLGWAVGAAETGTLINAMQAQPTIALVRAIDDLIITLKADGWWDEIGYLLVPVLHTEQASLLNWKNPGQSAANNGCAFTAFQGFEGNGVGAWIETIAPSAVPGITTPNGGDLLIWVEDGTGTNPIVSVASGTPTMTITPVNASSNWTGRVHQTAQSAFGMPGSKNGLFQHVRTGATAVAGYYNGALLGSDNDAATTIQTLTTVLLRANSVFTDDRVLAFGMGGAPTADPADLHTALETFYDAIGTVHS